MIPRFIQFSIDIENFLSHENILTWSQFLHDNFNGVFYFILVVN